MKKNLCFLFSILILSACRTASPIVTTKANAPKPQAKTTAVIAQNSIQKKVRKEEDVIEIKTNSNDNLPDIPTEFNNNFDSNKQKINSLSSDIVEAAKDNIGSRYKTGGLTKSGFDCSGLVYSSFGKFDIKLPRTSIEMSRFGTKINIKEAQTGDLIFFKTLGNKQINHVGIVVEVLDDEVKFIHASIKKGVIISTTKEGYYKGAFAQINRVLN